MIRRLHTDYIPFPAPRPTRPSAASDGRAPPNPRPRPPTTSRRRPRRRQAGTRESRPCDGPDPVPMSLLVLKFSTILFYTGDRVARTTTPSRSKTTVKGAGDQNPRKGDKHAGRSGQAASCPSNGLRRGTNDDNVTGQTTRVFRRRAAASSSADPRAAAVELCSFNDNNSQLSTHRSFWSVCCGFTPPVVPTCWLDQR